MAIELKSGAGADIATVDSTAKAVRATLYKTTGAAVTYPDVTANGAQKVELYGTTEGGGDSIAISASGEGHLEIAIQEPKGVFGEIIVAELTPAVQLDFIYGINSNFVTSTLTGSGTATSSNQLGIASTTAATNSSAQLRSYRVAKYRPGQGIECRFTAMYTTGVSNSTQIAGLANADIDGFFIGYNGSSFGVMYRRNSSDTWTAQASFNQDVLDGTGQSGFTIDPTKINIFRVQVGYLGVFGALFSVLNTINNQWIEFHYLPLTNARTTPQSINATMSMLWEARNTSNSSSISVSGASAGIFLQGRRDFSGGIYGIENNKSIDTTTTNVVTIKNNTTINSITNRSVIVFRSISASTASTTPVLIKAVKNTTLGGSPSYTNIDATNSMASYDTAGTTLTGGTTVYNFTLGSTGATTIDVSQLGIFLQPGETLTFSAARTSGGAATHQIAVNWYEDL